MSQNNHSGEELLEAVYKVKSESVGLRKAQLKREGLSEEREEKARQLNGQLATLLQQAKSVPVEMREEIELVGEETDRALQYVISSNRKQPLNLTEEVYGFSNETFELAKKVLSKTGDLTTLVGQAKQMRPRLNELLAKVKAASPTESEKDWQRQLGEASLDILYAEHKGIAPLSLRLGRLLQEKK